ncbi:MAG: hypothetical protein WCT77_03295 [Bacteroidota bacterium]
MKNVKFLNITIKIISCVFGFVLLLCTNGIAQDINETCLGCHSDPEIAMEKNGKQYSLFVKKFVLAKSPHAKKKCTDCHVGFDPENVPHKENITPVNCKKCHGDVSDKHTFHPAMPRATGMDGAANVNCKGCHGKHNIISPKKSESKFYFSKIIDACGSCHKSQKEEHLQSEHFFEYSNNNPNVPTCIFCHKLPITKGSLLDPVQLKINQERLCLSCHLNNPNQTKYSKSLINYEKSVHGSALLKGRQEAAACIDCHGSHNLQKAEAPLSRVNHFKVPELCGKCHFYIAREYTTSTHGLALKRGDRDAPACTYCHGEHGISPIPNVPQRVYEETQIKHSTVVRNKMVYCVGCHADVQMMSQHNLSTVTKAHDWIPSKATHWETVRCVDCHSSYEPPNLSHNILPPEKTIKKCEECHTQNSILLTKLYKHEKQRSREKYGFINGTLLSDAYVVGTTRNVFLDTFSVVIFGFTFLGIGGHAFLRWNGGRKLKNSKKNNLV